MTNLRISVEIDTFSSVTGTKNNKRYRDINSTVELPFINVIHDS